MRAKEIQQLNLLQVNNKIKLLLEENSVNLSWKSFLR